MAVPSTPFVPKFNGFAEIEQLACNVSVTVKVAVAVPFVYTAARASRSDAPLTRHTTTSAKNARDNCFIILFSPAWQIVCMRRDRPMLRREVASSCYVVMLRSGVTCVTSRDAPHRPIRFGTPELTLYGSDRPWQSFFYSFMQFV